MNPHRFKVKGFVAVQYRSLWFGNYRAVGCIVVSRLLLAGGCKTIVRGSPFDKLRKLTMRESEDCRESSSAMRVNSVCNISDQLYSTTLPHGELVEPRTTNHEPRIMALQHSHQIPLQNVAIFID